MFRNPAITRFTSSRLIIPRGLAKVAKTKQYHDLWMRALRTRIQTTTIKKNSYLIPEVLF